MDDIWSKPSKKISLQFSLLLRSRPIWSGALDILCWKVPLTLGQATSLLLTSPVCSEERLCFELHALWIKNLIEGWTGCCREKPSSSGSCLDGMWARTGCLGAWTIPHQVFFFLLFFIVFCNFIHSTFSSGGMGSVFLATAAAAIWIGGQWRRRVLWHRNTNSMHRSSWKSSQHFHCLAKKMTERHQPFIF